MKHTVSVLSLYPGLAQVTPERIRLQRPRAVIEAEAVELWRELVDLDTRERVRDIVTRRKIH